MGKFNRVIQYELDIEVGPHVFIGQTPPIQVSTFLSTRSFDFMSSDNIDYPDWFLKLHGAEFVEDMDRFVLSDEYDAKNGVYTLKFFYGTVRVSVRDSDWPSYLKTIGV